MASSSIGLRLRVIKPVLKKLRTNVRLLAVLGVTLVQIILNFGGTTPDSILYVHLSLFFVGRWPYLPYLDIIATRPMVPLLASPLIAVLGDAYTSIGLVSSFFWMAGVVVAFKVGKMLLKDDDLATLVALSYATSPTLLMYGAAIMTDSAGFFFTGLGIYLTLRREQDEAATWQSYFLDGLIVSLGVLFREAVLFALAFMLVRRLWRRKGYMETLLAALVVGGLELVFMGLLGFDTQILTRKLFWHQFVAEHERVWGFLPYLFSVGRAFGTSTVLPIFSIVSSGFWIWTVGILFLAASTVIGFIFATERKNLFMILLFLVPNSFIWPIMLPRFAFGMWPAVLPAMIGGAYLVFSHLPFTRERIPFNPKICVCFVVLLMGVINTVDALIR